MHSLFDNAIQSIQLGVEDFGANDPKRTLSAVRNFYAGTLLLAKEVLVRAAPKASPDTILAARLKVVPDGKGDVLTKSVGHRTIDFVDIGERFKDFGLQIDHSALQDLNRIRAEVEHLYTTTRREKVQEAIAKAFPVVVQLFQQLRVEPRTALGDSWRVMLDARSFYERQLAECQGTFSNIDWSSSAMGAASPTCPRCKSELVARSNTTSRDYQDTEAQCRACGAKISAENLIAASLAEHFAGELYDAIKDGGPYPLHHCPECGLETYVTVDEEDGCAWCGEVVEGDCARCGTTLHVDNVAFEDQNLCSYCNYQMSKDD
jgi:DNA-directed RNA polymerase subunit RPC12/RpoP